MDKPTHTQVIGITSGKSGVGKTTVSVNLAVALHDMGYDVMILDANSSASNAQVALGTPCPFNLDHFMRGEKNLKEIIIARHYGGQPLTAVQIVLGTTVLALLNAGVSYADLPAVGVVSALCAAATASLSYWLERETARTALAN